MTIRNTARGGWYPLAVSRADGGRRAGVVGADHQVVVAGAAGFEDGVDADDRVGNHDQGDLGGLEEGPPVLTGVIQVVDMF